MTPSSLDAVDRAILHHLQQDAHQPLTDIAAALDVADNTVRNRIEKLEDRGVIRGYTIDVDYGKTDVQHHYLFVCTTSVQERESLVEEAWEIPGVIRVTSVMTGTQNVHVEVAAPSKEEITGIAYRLDEIGLTIEREHLIWSEHRQPYAGFRLEENR